MVGFIMAGHYLIVFEWLGVLLLTMLVLLRLCICEYAMTIGCWNANVVVDSYFGEETWHHACSHAVFDAALSIPAAACLSQTVSVFTVILTLSDLGSVARHRTCSHAVLCDADAVGKTHSSEVASAVDSPKGTLVPRVQLAVVDEVEAKRCGDRMSEANCFRMCRYYCIAFILFVFFQLSTDVSMSEVNETPFVVCGRFKHSSPPSPNYQLSSTFNEDIYGVWFVVFLVFMRQSKRYMISGVAWQLTLSRPVVKKEAD
nr:hypothetical protein [Tanacetum cinerariifolium]